MLVKVVVALLLLSCQCIAFLNLGRSSILSSHSRRVSTTKSYTKSLNGVKGSAQIILALKHNWRCAVSCLRMGEQTDGDLRNRQLLPSFAECAEQSSSSWEGVLVKYSAEGLAPSMCMEQPENTFRARETPPRSPLPAKP